jgi:hypothetical protein
MDVISNSINALLDDDEDYVYLNDTSFSFDDNNDYNEKYRSRFPLWKRKKLLRVNRGDSHSEYVNKWWF